MKRNRIIVRAAAVLLVAVISVLQVGAYPTTSNYTYDGTGTLSSAELDSIAATSKALYESRGARLALCIVNSVVSVASENADAGLEDLIKDYARALYTEWKVGKGVLLLLSAEDGVYWAVQSDSMTDTLSDGKLSEILSSTLDEKLIAGDTATGVKDAVNALNEYLCAALEKNEEPSSAAGKVIGVILKIVAVVLLVVLAGYITLVILEKKKERERQRILEERRRQAAYRARQRSRSQSNGTGRPQGYSGQGGYSRGYSGQGGGYSQGYRDRNDGGMRNYPDRRGNGNRR